MTEPNLSADFLAAALEEAIEDMEDMILYVSEYYRNKWAYDAQIAKARDALMVYRLARDRNAAFADLESPAT